MCRASAYERAAEITGTLSAKREGKAVQNFKSLNQQQKASVLLGYTPALDNQPLLVNVSQEPYRMNFSRGTPGVEEGQVRSGLRNEALST